MASELGDDLARPIVMFGCDPRFGAAANWSGYAGEALVQVKKYAMAQGVRCYAELVPGKADLATEVIELARPLLHLLELWRDH